MQWAVYFSLGSLETWNKQMIRERQIDNQNSGEPQTGRQLSSPITKNLTSFHNDRCILEPLCKLHFREGSPDAQAMCYAVIYN